MYCVFTVILSNQKLSLNGVFITNKAMVVVYDFIFAGLLNCDPAIVYIAHSIMLSKTCSV